MTYEKISSRSPEEIERLALMAARKFSSTGDLQKAIIATISTEKGLTEEHIKRIVENTNTTVLQNLLKTEREKTIGFPVADPVQVYKQYSTVNPAEEKSPAHLDYDLPPQVILRKELEKKQQELREKTKPVVDQIPKDPYDNPTYVPPIQKAARIYNNCLLAEEWVNSTLCNLSHEYKSVEEGIRHLVKEGLLSGDLIVSELEKISMELPEIRPYLREVFLTLARSGEILQLQNNPLNKVATDLGDTELAKDHPLVKALEQVSEIQQTIDALTEALDVIKLRKAKSHKVVLDAN